MTLPTMDDDFYNRLLIALGHEKFDLDVNANKMLDSTRFLPQPILAPIQFTNVHGAAKADQIQKEFDPVTPFSRLIAFKFFLGQPIIACIVEADGRSLNELSQISSLFAQCIDRCTSYTLQPHGVVSGFLLFVFSDSTAAETFIRDAQKTCSHSNRAKKTSVRSWAIDIPGGRVVPERKSWLNEFGTLKPKKLANDLFAI